MGIPTLIKTLTASGDSALNFVNGSASVVLDSTYDEYMFVFTDINRSNDASSFRFNGSTDAGSNYNAIKTTTVFKASHGEDDTPAAVAYFAGDDTSQGTGAQDLNYPMGSGSDESGAGILHLFRPGSDTYVKHFYSRFIINSSGDDAIDSFVAGYFNTTDEIDAVTFIPGAGTFDGVIQMYGIA
jgi:hypothetical protein